MSNFVDNEQNNREKEAEMLLEPHLTKQKRLFCIVSPEWILREAGRLIRGECWN